MTDTKYTYSKATDFGGSVLLSNLFDEIEASSITTQINKTLTVVNGDTVDIWFKAALSAGEKTTLDNDASPAGGLIAAHDSAPPNPPNLVDINGVDSDADGNLMTVSTLPAGSETVKISHNFCDATTWYSNATQVVDEVATEQLGLGLQFNLANTNVIDVNHGKLYREDEDLTSYIPVVKVDSVVMTEDEYDGAQHDYWIDHAAGHIHFHSAHIGSTVEVTYYYATDSIYKIIPDTGKKLQIIRAEVQFTDDFNMKDALKFQIYHEGLAQVVQEVTYKNFLNIAMEAFGNFPELADIVGNRNMGAKLRNLPFAYTSKTDITPGLQVWIRLANDTECGGKHASATMHCAVTDSP